MATSGVVGFRACHRWSRFYCRKRLFSTITLPEEEEGILGADISRRGLLLRQSGAHLMDEIIKLRMDNHQNRLELENVRRELDDIKTGRRPLPWKDHNQIIRTSGPMRSDPKLKKHTNLLELLGKAKEEDGAVLYSYPSSSMFQRDNLNLALINLGLHFLEERGFPQFPSPRDEWGHYSKKESDFWVIGKGIRHGMPKGICISQLPIRYTEVSSRFCFDAIGDVNSSKHPILVDLTNSRTQTLEQVCITRPNREESSKVYEELLRNCEEFYGALGISYRVSKGFVPLTNGAERYYIDGWFPGSQTYKGLASCMLYTDCELLGTQSSALSDEKVDLVKSTLMVTEATIAGVLENHQKEGGIKIPEVMRMYMGGMRGMPFKFKENDIFEMLKFVSKTK